MNVKTRRLKRGLLIGSGAVVALVAIAASLLYALLRFGVVPLNDGEQLADGAIMSTGALPFLCSRPLPGAAPRGRSS
jgi:hypothetical protein